MGRPSYYLASWLNWIDIFCLGKERGGEERKTKIYEAFGYITKALELDSNNFACHKVSAWYLSYLSLAVWGSCLWGHMCYNKLYKKCILHCISLLLSVLYLSLINDYHSFYTILQNCSSSSGLASSWITQLSMRGLSRGSLMLSKLKNISWWVVLYLQHDHIFWWHSEPTLLFWQYALVLVFKICWSYHLYIIFGFKKIMFVDMIFIRIRLQE